MLRAIIADAIFCAALFVESLAVLSMLQAVAGFELREEFTPILNAYHARTAPFAVLGGSLFAAKPPLWYADAVLIAAVLFFLFFIAQARNATAPYDDPGLPPAAADTRLEMAIDFLLPVVVCLIGALVTAPALLPFLTLPVALWLLLKRLFGRPSWFKVSPSYYVNVVLLGTLVAAIVAWAQ